MKTFASFLLLISASAFSQTFGDPSNFRPNPTVTHEKLNDVQQISDLSAHFWQSMVFPFKERLQLDENRKANYGLGYYAYPLGGYNAIIEYVTVGIAVKSKGKVVNAQSSGNKLSAEQKQLILSADLGSDIGINIQFRHKDPYKKNLATGDLVTGWTTITVVPHSEAEYPGGYTGAATYLSKNLIKKMPEKEPQVTVTFTITEEGKIVDAKLTNMRPDPKAEKLLQETIAKMPAWKPAKNSKGEKVKQEFNFHFGGGGC